MPKYDPIPGVTEITNNGSVASYKVVHRGVELLVTIAPEKPGARPENFGEWIIREHPTGATTAVSMYHYPEIEQAIGAYHSILVSTHPEGSRSSGIWS